jgi:hypothetical protein
MQQRKLFTRKETTMSTAKVAIPTLLAVFALLFAFKTTGVGTAGGGQAPSASIAEPTPYSADHARIPSGDTAQESPTTF